MVGPERDIRERTLLHAAVSSQSQGQTGPEVSSSRSENICERQRSLAAHRLRQRSAGATGKPQSGTLTSHIPCLEIEPGANIGEFQTGSLNPGRKCIRDDIDTGQHPRERHAERALSTLHIRNSAERVKRPVIAGKSRRVNADTGPGIIKHITLRGAACPSPNAE